jgi:hypothetical protein
MTTTKANIMAATFDANAVAGEVDLGKIVYVDGKKITGTRPSEYFASVDLTGLDVPTISVGTAVAAI